MGKEVIPIPILLALLVLLSYCVAYALALEHKCIHDTEEMQTLFYGPVVDNITGLRHAFTPQGILERTVPQQYQPMPPPDAPDEVHRAFHATAVGNIRIATSTSDLDIPGRYCAKVGDRVPNFKGGTVTCTNQEDILTTEKRDILLNKILKNAIALLSNALMVNRVKGNLKTRGCSRNIVPPSHPIDGIPDADYVLYVSAAPTTGARAFATFCESDTPGRPISGRINFNPKHLVWDAVDPLGRRELVRTGAHEIMHALGFHKAFWATYPKPKEKIPCTHKFCKVETVATEERRKKTVYYFNSKNVKKKAREYFNCSKLSGPEVEDEGVEEGSLYKYSSHWKRKYHFDDIMSPITGRRKYLSHITLASFEDSGHYFINWTAAETPKWMHKAGCGVLKKKCNTKAGGMGKYFCDDGKHKKRCTPDNGGIGVCRVTDHKDLPTWGRYFGDLKKGGANGNDGLLSCCGIYTTVPLRQPCK